MTPKSFIEVQFPVSKLSKESYKERKAHETQTLSSLGKWHGRKPLVLVRALILGLLLPATEDPRRDRDTFLKLMTMDDEGMWRRCKGLSAKIAASLLTPSEQEQAIVAVNGRVGWVRSLSRERRKSFEKRAFLRLGYDERLHHCVRPEEIDGPDEAAWKEINTHLGTSATSLPELVQELGQRRFGHVPRLGDAFAGGGSIPFEAARLGCEALASDLNPVAALQCYGALRLIGGPPETLKRVKATQREVYEAVCRQVREWGIEQNEFGWQADVYLYCNEVMDPATGWRVPLLPSLMISHREAVVAELVPHQDTRSFKIEICQGVAPDVLATAAKESTSSDGVICPVDRAGNWIPSGLRQRTSSKSLRGPNGLRMWEPHEFRPQPDDVFQERLYCIRWILPNLEQLLLIEQVLRAELQSSRDHWTAANIGPAVDALQNLLPPAQSACVAAVRAQCWGDKAHKLLCLQDELPAVLPDVQWGDTSAAGGAAESARLIRKLPAEIQAGLQAARTLPPRWHAAPTVADLAREQQCAEFLAEHMSEWQDAAFLPMQPMQPGKAIKDPIRNRGWTYWHHLYNPRQLVTNGLFLRATGNHSPEEAAALLLGCQKVADHNSKCCRWDAGRAQVHQTLDVVKRIPALVNFASRSSTSLARIYLLGIDSQPSVTEGSLALGDTSSIQLQQDLWITDPGYGDMAPYAEYSEFYLAWVGRQLLKVFPAWYADSKRALAVELADDDFFQVLHRCYSNLTIHMPSDGLQIVMFTQQDTQVWADLTLVLWAAGLHVIQAWTIGTETRGGTKEGGDSTVQGTVCLVLRKRSGGEHGDLSEIKPEVQMEVRRQLDSMHALDDREDPNFTDADLQLAAYAAALRVITGYERIAEIDIARELARGGRPDPQGIVRGVIDQALREATEYLVPDGLERSLWRSLNPEERFYLKGVEVEAHGERRNGVYQEFARGFGVREFKGLLQSDQANETRLRTPSELKGRDLDTGALGGTPVRYAMYAVYQTVAENLDPRAAVAWLRGVYPGMLFFDQRQRLVRIFRYLAEKPGGERMPHWNRDSEAARILAARLENES